MKPKLSLLVGSAVLSAGLVHISAAEAGKCLRRPPSDRGIAIFSPLECPDPCDTPVGGHYRYTPYYPGWIPDRRCPVIYGSVGYGYVGSGTFGNTSAGYARGDYGAYSGASKDEEGLLHLGGSGPSSKAPLKPYNAGNGDLIDRIQGNR